MPTSSPRLEKISTKATTAVAVRSRALSRWPGQHQRQHDEDDQEPDREPGRRQPGPAARSGRSVRATSANFPLREKTSTANRTMNGRLDGSPASDGWSTTNLVDSEAATPMASPPA